MSPEKLAKTFGRIADRRRFLRRAGAVGLGAVGFMSLEPLLAEPAHALWNGRGCHLCNPPTTTCGPAVECVWCWNGSCVGGYRYNCCEGYRAGVQCGPQCPAYCSWTTNRRAC